MRRLSYIYTAKTQTDTCSSAVDKMVGRNLASNTGHGYFVQQEYTIAQTNRSS